MAAPDVTEFAQRYGRTQNDPEVVLAWSAALSWARKTLGRPADDTLADLDADNVVGLHGYAGDLLKLPKSTFGMFAPDDIDGLQVIAGDIGRRWAGHLRYGHGTAVSFA